MLSGAVDSRLQVKIRFPIYDSGGQRVDVETTVDTGFTGWLTLPRTTIVALRLVWLSRRTVVLADGSAVQLDTYEATVLWDGTLRNVQVYAIDSDALVGTKMLQGYALRAEFKVGGGVTIEALP
jgi:clan AA aspartic protease